MHPAIARCRAQFPILEAGTSFFDWAATGLLPQATRAELESWLARLASLDASESTWIHAEGAAVRADVRERLAAMTGSRPADFALVESTSAGLGIFASCIPTDARDNVVLAEADYLAVAMPWRHRAERSGLELRFVPSVDGEIRAEDLLARVDERTRVVSVSTVAWSTGRPVDLPLLEEGLRDHRAALIVDAIQSFGVLPIDLRSRRIDALVAGGHKWLCSPLGAGFLWVRPGAAERFGLPPSGFLSAQGPRGPWGAWFADPASTIEDRLTWTAAGRAFEVGGTPSYPGAMGLRGALSVLAEVPAEAAVQHVLALRRRLGSGLDRLGIARFGAADPAALSPIEVVRWPGGVAAEREVVQRLAGQRIFASVRYAAGQGGIRLSWHLMNTAEDIDRLIDALAAELRRTSPP